MFGNDLADELETKFLLPMAIRKTVEANNLEFNEVTSKLILKGSTSEEHIACFAEMTYIYIYIYAAKIDTLADK